MSDRVWGVGENSMRRRIETDLLAWKEKSDDQRMPLLLNGARQVGKTYILRTFGAEHFKNVAYVNLEANQAAASIFAEDLSPQHLIRYLESTIGEKILPGKTLLFLDEVQSCERALTSLKYFCEDAPKIHVAAAGSLLGVAVNREKYSFPVGKVETLALYPLDFEEYLWARGRESLAEEIRSHCETLESLPEGLHKVAQELYREYLVVGGMPACVNAFAREKSFLDAASAQTQIVNASVADMAKYATASESVKIRACYQSIPAQLAKENRKFQYKVVRKGGSAALFGESIEWLTLAGLVLKCQKISHAYVPVSVHMELSSFKLYMGDVGLLMQQSGIPQQLILSGIENQFLGAVAENYVAQQLAARGHALVYWESDSTAEVDFVMQRDMDIVGIEVKSGLNTRSRSLNVFSSKYNPAYNIRLSLKNFGQTGSLRSIPLYAAFCL